MKPAKKPPVMPATMSTRPQLTKNRSVLTTPMSLAYCRPQCMMPLRSTPEQNSMAIIIWITGWLSSLV